jgi:hypothetical protein
LDIEVEEFSGAGTPDERSMDHQSWVLRRITTDGNSKSRAT